MLLNHKQPHILAVAESSTHSQTVHRDLYPGLNEVSKELVESMKKHPILKTRFEDGSLEVIEEAGQPVENYSKLKEPKAKQLIAETSDLTLLNDWLDKETRQGIKKALQAQIDKIEKPEDQNN